MNFIITLTDKLSVDLLHHIVQIAMYCSPHRKLFETLVPVELYKHHHDAHVNC